MAPVHKAAVRIHSNSEPKNTMKSPFVRNRSHVVALLPLLASAMIVASCMPISPLSFPLSGGPTPPYGVSPASRLSSAVVAQSADAVQVGDAQSGPVAVESSAVVTKTVEVAAASPVTGEVAITAEVPALQVAGLGGMAAATSAGVAPAQVEMPAQTTPPGSGVVPKPIPPLQPITLVAAVDCLNNGQVVYGLALQNTNVRENASANSCRIGRIPRGTLVRITAALPAPGAEVGAATAVTTAAAAPATASEAPGLGYTEDVQPIVQRNCSTCHSGVAKIKELQVTSYAGIMKGSAGGPVVIPGDSTGSLLWQMINTGKMPVTGALTADEKSTIKQWIDDGALESRPIVAGAPVAEEASPAAAAAGASSAENPLWLGVEPADVNPVTDPCAAPNAKPEYAVSSQLVLPVVCGAAPEALAVDQLRAQLGLPTVGNPNGLVVRPAVSKADSPGAANAVASSTGVTATEAASVTTGAASTISTTAIAPSTATQSAAPVSPVQAAIGSAAAAGTGIVASSFGLAPPTDEDPWLIPRGGLCVERKLPDNDRGITALTFAPDGRLFLAFDAKLTGEDVDQIMLYDAFHPSRSIGVIDSNSMQGLTEILQESPRITGMDWQDGALYISRAGEVGRIVDGDAYETLASGFAVNGRLFHANNGLVIANGWLYVSAGGVRDGYSDGPLVDISEAAAQEIVSGGNPYAARIVRAPLDVLLSQRSINAFSTAGRGTRNPYGITADATGRLWFTDNGATNVPDGVSAGDEVDILNPGTIGADEASSPYYGFPLAILQPQDWYNAPAVILPNTSAPTGITWALGTIYYAQYGKDPGLYRLGVGADGMLVSERVMLGWPILSLATAPDGALWVGLGDGSLFRMTSGC